MDKYSLLMNFNTNRIVNQRGKYLQLAKKEVIEID